MDKKIRPFLSIVLPTYNRLYSIPKIILPSIEKQSFLDYELIVVDDGSTDGTESYFKSQEFKKEFPNCAKRLIYIKNSKNLGLPTSRNVGVSNASGKWIQMVEDDLELNDKIFLEKLVKILEKSDNKTIYVPRLITQNKIYKKSKGKEIVSEGKITKEIYANYDSENSGYVISGHSCTILPKECFNSLKYDAELLKGNYFREETDFYKSASNEGYKLFFTSELKLIHHNNIFSGGCKSTKSLVKLEYFHLKNHYKYLKKHFNFAILRFISFMIKREINNITKLSINFLKKSKYKNSVKERLSPKIFDPHYFLLKHILKGINEFKKTINEKSKVLDYGCGKSPYKTLIVQKTKNYFGADIFDGENIDFIIGKTFNEEAEQYTHILCTEVLEHDNNYKETLKLFEKIIKKEGYLFVSTPFLWPEHGSPYDYQRLTINRMYNLSDKLKCIGVKKSNGLFITFGTFLNDFFNEIPLPYLIKSPIFLIVNCLSFILESPFMLLRKMKLLNKMTGYYFSFYLDSWGIYKK